jgi:hypothetical protein
MRQRERGREREREGERGRERNEIMKLEEENNCQK